MYGSVENGVRDVLCIHVSAREVWRCGEGTEYREATWWMDDNDRIVRSEYGEIIFDKRGGTRYTRDDIGEQ